MGGILPEGTPAPSDAVVDVNDDVERRIQRELSNGYQRGEAIALFVGAAAILVFFWSDLATSKAGVPDLPLTRLLLLRTLLAAILGGMGWMLWKAKSAPRLTPTFDIASIALVSALVGYAHVLSRGANPLYFGSIATIAFLRCLYVPSGWKMAAATCTGGWLAGLGTALAAHAVLGVPDTPFYWDLFGAIQGNVAMNGALAVGGAALVHRLRRQEIAARASGRYEMRTELGAGGFGTVYEAWDKLLERPCAIKMLDPRFGQNEELVRRFELEAKATCRLQNPHIVQVHDYGCTRDQRLYYVMERLEGRDLRQITRDEGPLAPGRVVPMMRQAAAALAEAHRKGVVHRDIKPENLFITPDDTGAEDLKVLDFGLAAAILPGGDGSSARERPSGTAWYMPAERARGERGDGRSDVYSLGAVMYEALTGTHVFEGDTPMAVLVNQLQMAPERPSLVSDRVPDYLDAIVLRCLARDPGDRFQDMPSLLKALDTAADRLVHERPAQAWA